MSRFSLSRKPAAHKSTATCMKYHLLRKCIKTEGVYLGFDTSGKRKFPYRNFRTTRFLQSQNTERENPTERYEHAMTKCDNCVCCHCTKIKCSQYPYQKCIRCITEKQLPMYFCDDFILRKPYEKKPMQIRKYVPIHNQLQQIIERLTRIEEMLNKKE